MSLNPGFKNYKNKHLGESAFVIGTGPSYLKFEEYYNKNKNQFKNIIKIGCNSLVYSNIKMDYFFIGDKNTGYGSPKCFLKNIETYANYKSNITNFARSKWKCEPYSLIRNKNYVPYLTNVDDEYFPIDISKEGINRRGSISMDMMQFALYSGFKKIYLVGHDCNYGLKNSLGNNMSHFNENCYSGKNEGVSKKLLMMWNNLNLFIKKNYIDVEILSVNPESLKLFKETKLKDIIC